MANWAKLQETLTDLPVYKRAKHGIHFDKGNGQIEAHFSGKPCHYQDTDGLWKPIDTRLLLSADGFYGCPHSPVKVHQDGRVKVTGSDYSQFTKLPGSPIGRVDGDKIVREFPGGYQELFVTEDGFREVITVNKPTFPLEKFIGKTSGTLPSAYKAGLQTAVDANGDVFEITSDTKAFGDWLDGAVYPVTIDPDFASGASFGYVRGANADFATAKSTSTASGTDIITFGVASSVNRILRGYIKFDTSSIDDGATITQVNFKAAFSSVDTNPSDTIQINKYDWSGQDPLSSDNREYAYDGALAADADAIFVTTGTASINTYYTSANLSTAWINKTGSTYYALLSKTHDIDGTGWVTGTTNHVIYNPGHATYPPVLTVTYTTGGGFHPINLSAQMQSLTGGMRG